MTHNPGAISCKRKRTFFTAEEALHLGNPSLTTYHCSGCGNYHQTSQKNKNQGNRKRYDKWRYSRKDKRRGRK